MKIAVISLGAVVAITGAVIIDSQIKGLDAQATAKERDRSSLALTLGRMEAAHDQYLRSHDVIDLVALLPIAQDTGLAELVMAVRAREMVSEACESADDSSQPASTIENRCKEVARHALSTAPGTRFAGGLHARNVGIEAQNPFTERFQSEQVTLEAREAEDDSVLETIRTRSAGLQRYQVLITGLAILIALAKDLIPEARPRTDPPIGDT